jgi:hypothetical protein
VVSADCRANMSGATVTPRRQSTFANTGVRMVPIGNGPRHKPWCRAIKTRATKRSIAFLVAGARPFDSGIFRSARRAFDRGRMRELWNSWYETLASVEALAVVIVFVLVAAGVIVLADRRR